MVKFEAELEYLSDYLVSRQRYTLVELLKIIITTYPEIFVADEQTFTLMQ